MGIEAISELVAVLLAASLVTERLVLAIRTPKEFFGLFPLGNYLNNEKEENDDIKYKYGSRRLFVQMISLGCALFTVGWLAVGDNWNPLASIKIGEQTFPLWLIAILATGGSAFWKNILGYTKAVRDIRKDVVEKNK